MVTIFIDQRWFEMSRNMFFSKWHFVSVSLALQASLLVVAGATPPNIVTIIADDMGWNDIGFHGSNQIPTPNIDALAYNGVILNRHYTLPTCTPSRTAFLTGINPIRIGMQGKPILAGEERGVPLDIVTLPKRLKKLGYVTRIVGKWHQGSFKTEYMPTKRGFDSFLGYWNGYIGYFNHSINYDDKPGNNGIDFHRDLAHTTEFEGQYATDVFTRESAKIIAEHDTSKPLYLNIAHLAVHAGNIDKPMEVPDEGLTHIRFRHIASSDRRIYAGMMTELDKSVGQVFRALSDKGILNNTIVVFLSDNGAPTTGVYKNYGSNWPLRGIKDSLHEGGIRNVAAIWSAGLQQPGRVSNQLFHLTDWLPTLYSAAGGDVSDLGDIDGVDQWPSLISTKSYQTPRSRLLLNIEANTSEGLIDGKWKIAKVDQSKDKYGGFYGDSGQGKLNSRYNIRDIISSLVNRLILRNKHNNRHAIWGPDVVGLIFYLDRERILQMRSQATVSCPNSTREPINCSSYCLYDIYSDPCETTNLASTNNEKLVELIGVLNKYREQSVPQLNKLLDPAANPTRHNQMWVPWLDQEYRKCSGNNQCTATVTQV